MARSTIGETGGFVNDADAVDAMMCTFFAGSFLANYLLIRPMLDVAAGAESGIKAAAKRTQEISEKLKQNGVSYNPFNPNNKYGMGMLPYLIATGAAKVKGGK